MHIENTKPIQNFVPRGTYQVVSFRPVHNTWVTIGTLYVEKTKARALISGTLMLKSGCSSPGPWINGRKAFTIQNAEGEQRDLYLDSPMNSIKPGQNYEILIDKVAMEKPFSEQDDVILEMEPESEEEPEPETATEEIVLAAEPAIEDDPEDDPVEDEPVEDEPDESEESPEEDTTDLDILKADLKQMKVKEIREWAEEAEIAGIKTFKGTKSKLISFIIDSLAG